MSSIITTIVVLIVAQATVLIKSQKNVTDRVSNVLVISFDSDNCWAIKTLAAVS